MKTRVSLNTKKVPLLGISAAVIFAATPFMYGNILGNGLFIYLLVFYFSCLFIYAKINWNYKIKISYGITDKFFLACCIFQMVSFIWSPSISFDNIYSSIKIYILFFSLSLIRFSKKDVDIMYLLSTIIVLFSCYNIFTSEVAFSLDGVDAMRASVSFFGIMQDPNYLCFFYIVPSVWLFSVALNNKYKFLYRLISILLLLVIVFAILRTGSRGGLIAVIFALAAYFLFYKKLTVKKFFLILVVVLTAVLLFNLLISWLPEEVAGRYTIANVLSNGGSHRFRLWGQYFNKIFSGDLFSVLFGYGNGSSSYIMGTASHNDFLDLCFNYGFFGFVLFYAFYFSIILKAKSHKNWIAFSSMIGVWALSMSLSVGRMLYFWLTVAFINVILKNVDTNDDLQISKEIL